ncbi:DUF6090 family protein [Balneola sp. MJW-20]|uniref:DUF6090 family protein n=1 Tax=Gracilimonas aurantiaca TaxID=3234185 RepID=UPI003466A01B
MITLFRRIRQKLIDSGSVTKYLLYALGEILLVVIGILIALQVNEWNEKRKNENAYNKALTEISQNLNQDLQSIQRAVDFNEEIMQNLVRMADWPGTVPDDSLSLYMDALHRASSFDPVIFGYSKLTELDLPESIPDTLTRSLSGYYTEFNGGLNNIAYQELSIYNINKYRDYMIRRGFPVTNRGDLSSESPAVLRGILTDTEFRGIIRSNYYSRLIQRGGFEEARSMAEECLSLIEEQLSIE